MKKITLLLIIYTVAFTTAFAETMTIDIGTATELLHKNNMKIQMSAYDVRVAERNKKNAWNALLPKFGVSASSALMDNPRFSLGSGPDEPRFGLDFGVNASLSINYALGAAIKDLNLKYESGEISYETAVKGLEMNTKIQFYNLINMAEQIKNLKKGIDLAEKRYYQVQENYKNGLIPELDVLRTQVAFESQKPAYSNLQTTYENLLLGFKVMLGIDRNQDIELSGSLDTETYTFEAEDLIGNYLAKSLSLRSMNKGLETLENAKKMVSLYAYTPMLSLSYSNSLATYNPWAKDYVVPEDSWSLPGDDGIDMGTFIISLSFSLDNLIPGSSKNVEINNMEDQIRQLKLSLQESALTEEVKIINTISKLENSIEQLNANKLNVLLASKAYEMTNEAYQLGTKELLDVESAQNDLLNAEAAVLGEQLTYITEILNLEYTLNTSIEEIIK